MNAHVAYLKTEIMTATPPKLRLMLIEAALGLARQCRESWEDPMPESILRALSSLRKLLVQLLTSVDDKECELGRNIQRVYMYLFSTVTSVQLGADAGQLSDVVEVLEVERETWNTLSQRFVHEVLAHDPMRPQPTGAPSTPATECRNLAARTDTLVSNMSFSTEA